MSTQHNAEVKVTLRTSAFSAGLNKMGAETRTFAQSAKSTLSSSFHAGLHGAKEAFHGVTHSAGHLLKTAAAIGAGFSVEHAIHEALNLTSAWKQIAFSIQAGTGKTIDWREEMKEAEETANKWGVSTEDLTGAYKQLFQQTGNAEFTKHAMNEIAKTSQATGASLETVTAIAGEMNEKFGVTAHELPDALVAAASLANQGGMSIEEMSEKIGQLGGAAKLMGMDGTRGFQDIVGMANIAQKSLGPMKKTIAAVTGLMTEMTSADFGKKVHQQLGIKVTGAGGKLDKDALQKIIQRTGGKEEMLAKVFTGEQLKVVSDLGAVYAKTFDSTKGTIKQKTHEATVAYVEALKKAGAVTLTKAQMDERAAAVAEGPKAQIKKAMNEFAAAFTDPEMMDAIKEFAKMAPKLAHGLAKITDFILKHPILGTAGFVGGKMALGAAGGAVTDLGAKIGAGAVGAMKTSAVQIGGAIGNEIASTATAAGPWKTAGGVLAAAAAALIGFEVGKALSKETVEKDIAAAGKRGGSLSAAAASAHAALETGSVESKQKAIAMLKSRIAEEKKSRSMIPSTWGDVASLALGPMGLAAKKIGEGSLTGEGLSSAQKELAALEKSLATTGKSGDSSAKSFQQAAAAADRLTTSMNRAAEAGGNPAERGTVGGGGGPAPGAAPSHG